MSEHKEELERRLQAIAEKEQIWESFLEHPGWRLFTEMVTEQQKLREKSVIMTPVASVGQAFSQEMYKGEALGLGLALATPEAELEQARLERRVLTQELEIEDDAETKVAADGPGRFDPNPFGEFSP